MNVIYDAVCDIGLKRTINQDKLLAVTRNETGLFVVADGMGGHSHGEKASAEIVVQFNNWWNSFDESDYGNDFNRIVISLKDIIENSNRVIFQSSKDGEICGSTVVVLFIFHERYVVLSAGDSRVYYNKGFSFSRLTKDNTWENQTFLSEEELLEKKDLKGKLINAVGVFEKVKIYSRTDMLHDKESFLLCSDGLYKHCTDKHIRSVMRKKKHPGVLTRMLKTEVYQNGATDNVSIILVRINK